MEMKDSGIPWVGAIPKDWAIFNIGSCTSEISCANGINGETNALQFKMGEIIRKSEGNSKYNPETLETYNIVDKGVIMINGLNLSFDLISQRVGVVKERGVITSTYIAIKPNNNLYPYYFTYLMKAYDNCKAFHAMGRGLRQTLSYGELRKHPIFVPPFQLQQQIATFLDEKCADIDQLITLQQQMIDELKAYKQSVITEAVTKGLDKSVPMKDSGIEWIGKVPEGWEVLRLDKIGNFNKGLTITKDNLQEEGIPCVNYGEIHSKYGFEVNPEFNKLKCVDENYIITSPNSILKFGDFVFADTSEDLEGSGNFTYLNSTIQTFAGYHTIIFRTNSKKTVSRYLAYLFNSKSYRAQIQSKVKGVKVFSISQGILKSTYILLPELDKQNKIVLYLDEKCSQIDQLISVKQQKMDELKEYKKSMIYEYITGKKQVPN